MSAYLTVAQVADRAQFCERTVRRAIAAGELPAFRRGNRLRVREVDAVAWIEAEPVEVAALPPVRRSVLRGAGPRGSFRSLMEIDRRQATG